jgi:hypothetical protein
MFANVSELKHWGSQENLDGILEQNPNKIVTQRIQFASVGTSCAAFAKCTKILGHVRKIFVSERAFFTPASVTNDNSKSRFTQSSYRSRGRAGARPYRKKTPSVKPGVCTFSAGVRSFLVSDLEHHRQCECAGLIRREFPVASNPARGGVGKDAWTGYCLHIGDVPG